MFYGQCWKCGERWGLGTASTCKCPDETPKRTWVGLTEQEQGAIMEDLNAYGTNLYQFARAIEAKLKEKNT
jgi:hypothetical protein